VLGGLRDLLLGNQDLVDEFAAEFKRELLRLRRQKHGDSRLLAKQLEHGIKRCLDFIAGGDGDLGSVRDRLQELERRKTEINAERVIRQTEMSVDQPARRLSPQGRRAAEGVGR